VEGRAAAIARHAGPRTRAFVAKEGAAQAAKGPSVAAVKAAINAANLGSLSEGDIEALGFIVMAQAADDQDQDLKTIMAATKAQKGRGSVPAPRYTASFTVAGLSNDSWQSDVDSVKQNIDSKSELGEMTSMRLQMAMDRMSKLMDTLSNLMKANDNTSESILQNLK
jgi:hypothetical protein